MTPLVLVVGFLGAGKTTFLKKLLPALKARGLEPYVVINDYQNARVDAEQLRELTAAVDAISGDCVCCGSREELLASLEKFEHGSGKVVVVETNGTTDSEQLIEMLSLEAALKGFSLPLQVSLIDAQRWQKRFWHNALEREQARTASHVVISRLDTVPPTRLAEVETSLEHHKVRGRRVTVEEFSDELTALSKELAGEWDRTFEACEHCGGHHDHDHDHEEHHHHHGDHHFSSMELPLPESVSQSRFTDVLKNLPDEVIRAKGLVRFTEKPDELFVFQKVDRFEEPQFFPVGANPRVKTPLALFIGPELPEERIRTAVGSL